MATHDELVEVRIELEDIRRQLTEAESHLGGLRKRVGMAGYRLGELARGAVASATGTAGLPCTADVAWTRPALKHDFAPPPHAADATACMDDEPPSRPA